MPKTLYALCLQRLGLSQPEAAELHGNRIDTIKKRCTGTLGVPDGVWDDLRGYAATIAAAAPDINGDHAQQMAAADQALGRRK